MALTAAKGTSPWQFSFCARKKKTPLSLCERQRRTNLCGTTLVAAHRAAPRLFCNGNARRSLLGRCARWVRGSQVIFSGAVPPLFHRVSGSLGEVCRVLVLFKALGCLTTLYYRADRDLSTVFPRHFAGKAWAVWLSGPSGPCPPRPAP